ncbi:GH39 family glycosyl hydrolase [Persicobacter psychrovividus]|uniref:Beta-xylosidase n=1 Tax=Persicobacter psychrovividus TaxID=387638 RepID=A0ABN6LII6_9BACT|nr:beta-xylosidase [Persicobacter psychrovividus]
MKKLYFLLFLIGTSCTSKQATNPQVNVNIDLNTTIGQNHQFWKALGYDFLFKIVNEPEGQYFLDRAQQKQSVKYYRAHYTFSNTSMVDERAGGKVGGQVVRTDKNGKRYYDFSIVNQTFREYVKRGMKPIVECDFYPDGFASEGQRKMNDEEFEAMVGAPADWNAWEDLLNAFMKNLVDEFGKEEIKSWYFEVWNEPDGWKGQDQKDFFKMYDLFAYTVKKYDNDFKVGGPACYHLGFLEQFVEHVVHGKNYITKKTGSPVDFLSYHIYALSGYWLKPSPDIYPQVSKFSADMLWLQRLMYQYPSLKGVEFHLNEWGLSSHGDSKFVDEYPQLEYRNSEVSALFMVKLVDCLYAIEDNHGLKTSLLGYWGSWFNAKTGPIFRGSRDLMTRGNVPKPILSAYELLAKLKDNRVKVKNLKAGNRYGCMATKDDSGVALMAYNFNETDDDFSKVADFDFALENGASTLKGKKVKVIRLDRKHNNTYRKWLELGAKPVSDELVTKLKEVGELKEVEQADLTFDGQNAHVKVSIPRHGMALILIE